MGVGDGVGLRSRPRSRSSSSWAEFNAKNVVLPTSSRNSRLYARLKTGRRDEYVQKHCVLQDKKHENTVLSGEREAAASVVRAAILEHKSQCLDIWNINFLSRKSQTRHSTHNHLH